MITNDNSIATTTTTTTTNQTNTNTDTNTNTNTNTNTSDNNTYEALLQKNPFQIPQNSRANQKFHPDKRFILI